MRIQRQWIDEPMSAAASVETAAYFSRELEDRVCRAEGVNLGKARRIVAREAAIPMGTLENLRREPPRLKSIPAWIEGRLAALMVRKLEAEISRLSHDMEIARRISIRPDADEVREAAAALAAAQSSIEKLTRNQERGR